MFKRRERLNIFRTRVGSFCGSFFRAFFFSRFSNFRIATFFRGNFVLQTCRPSQMSQTQLRDITRRETMYNYIRKSLVRIKNRGRGQTL